LGKRFDAVQWRFASRTTPKLTFELGKIAASVTVDFEITNFALVEVAA
jgi:hypothetical protein